MNPSPFSASDSRSATLSGAATVRTANDLAFGVARSVSGDRLQVEADLGVVLGERVEVRLDLGPAPGSALLVGAVSRSVLVAPGETPRFFVRIVDVADEDRERCAAWLESALSGGTLSNFSGLSSGFSRRAAVRDALERASEITVLE